MHSVNPVQLEIYKNRFSSVAEEMGMTLNRTAFSPNIKERRDYSCAIFNAGGEMVAQAAHIPVHLGSMPMSVREAISNIMLRKGEMVILNDPFKGGTHLPDVTLVAPVYSGNSDENGPLFYIANRAHHSDIGGMNAGSMSLATSIYQEGLIIPAVRIIKDNRIDEEIMAFILSNVRTPEERRGDFSAQFMANITGIRRIGAMIERHGIEPVILYSNEMINYSEKMMRRTIKKIPDGHYSFIDYLDSDGISDEKAAIRVKVSVNGEEAVVDFSKTSRQVRGSVNATYAITASAVLYVFRCLVEANIPTNAGCLAPIHIITEKGSLLDAEKPAAVAGGNVETSQRIVDVLLGALSKAIPEKIPAASQGTMNNIAIGGIDERTKRAYTYYETIGGGTGATRNSDGENAIHSHMTNTMNTPAEAIEYEYPFRIKRYSIRVDSGGKGAFNGGNGIIREFELLNDSEVSMLSERRITRPYGLHGANPGQCGVNLFTVNGEIKKLPGKFNRRFVKGSVIRVETPGGGGFNR